MSLIELVLDDVFINIMSRFLINIVVIFLIIRVIYYRYARKEEFLFSFFLMGIIVFFICSILETVELQLGMALGLFAVFSILRFRTVNYTVKDMTYVFVVIGVSVINSLANIPPPFGSALAINAIIVIAVYSLELFYQQNSLSNVIVVYNKPELLVPALKEDLLKDLSERMGQDVKKVKIRKVNLSSGNADVEVYFRDRDMNQDKLV